MKARCPHGVVWFRECRTCYTESFHFHPNRFSLRIPLPNRLDLLFGALALSPLTAGAGRTGKAIETHGWSAKPLEGKE